jgi:hypothetical protein
MILALTLALAAAQPAMGQDGPNDVFIGTITIEQNAAILSRCDLGNTPYVLRDAVGRHTVLDLVRGHRSGDQPIYGEVIASYQEQDGTNILTVASIRSRKMGKDCHLTPPPAPAGEAKAIRPLPATITSLACMRSVRNCCLAPMGVSTG